MPSKSKADHHFFWPLLVITFILWWLYRSLFHFDVWFDELIGKAIFFGLPVWAYLQTSRAQEILDTLSPKKVNSGLLLGLALGGIYGFAGSIVSLMASGANVQMVPLFVSSTFWWEFFLALMTGFWESLFFFSWIMTIIMIVMKKWPLALQIGLNASIFLAFHLPNSILRFSGPALTTQIILMFVFGLGQSLLFARWKNFYALVISHAIWGMALLIHM